MNRTDAATVETLYQGVSLPKRLSKDAARCVSNNRKEHAMNEPKTHITKKQISRIWTIARAIKLPDEHLYLIVFSVTGSQSISALSRLQAHRLLQKLASMQFEHTKENRVRIVRHKNVHHLPTDEQRALIDTLVSDINNYGRLVNPDNIAHRTWQKPLEKLHYHQTQGLIEALKSIRNRAQSQYQQHSTSAAQTQP